MTARRLLLSVALLLAPLAPLAPLHAAPPSLMYLFPAGARRGTTVEVSAGGAFERWPVGAWVKGPGVTVKPAKDKGKLIVTVAADATPGSSWLRLYDDEGASIARPFLIGLLPEVMEKEPNNEPKQAQKLEAADVIVNGRLDKAGDVDVFAVPLQQGQTLVASIEAHRTLRSPMDAVLQVLSEDGFVLAQNNDFHGLDPQIAFTAPRDGTFFVRLFAFPAVPDASIRFSGGATYVYRLTLTTKGFVDYPYPLAVTAGQPAEVELIGWSLPAAARRIALPPTAKGPVATIVHAEIGNHVDVALEPHFTLALRATTSRTRPQLIPVPATVTGRLGEAGATSFYEFQGRKGKTLLLRVESQSLDFEVEPVLRLTDTAGKVLARGEAAKLHGDAVLSFTPPQDAPYRLEVLDLHGAGGPRHVYRLSVATSVPDFALTVASDRFTLMPGTPLDIPVTIERRGGFAEAITLTAQGLPAEVTANAITVKTSDKKTTLRLTAASATAASALRIIGKSEGMTAFSHTARAVVAERDSTTDDLWLTVRKAPTK
jgi:hypothetical protein